MRQPFFLRLQPPRPTFAADRTEAERALMGQHAAYAKRFFEAGTLLAYGPVLDPDGAFRIAILQVDQERELSAFVANDPSVAAGMNRYTYAPMILGGSQTPRAS